MRELDVAAVQPADELHVVVAGHAEGESARYHGLHDPQDVGCSGAPIDEVTNENGPAARGRTDAARARIRPRDDVTQLLKQGFQLIGAAVHVTDDVEGAGLMPRIAPQ